MKLCTRCLVKKPLDSYGDKPIRGKPALDPRCIECVRAVARENYVKNKDKIIAYQKKYYRENAEYVAKRQAEYVNRNKEKTRAYLVDYHKRNREKLLIKSREWYAENKDKCRAWREDNYDKVQATRAARRARKRAAKGRFTNQDVDNLKSSQKNRCIVCKRNIKDNYQIDHIIPLAKGGDNSRYNIQLLCRACNQSKGAKHPIDFMQTRGYLL